MTVPYFFSIMALKILLLITGLIILVLGADWLVDGSSSIARRLKISEFVIGLTIVGFGTSCPELVVSLTGALEGMADVAIGNVVGSNIFNVLLILGLTAVVSPIAITDNNRKVDKPIVIGTSFLMIILGMNRLLLHLGSGDVLSRADGIVFLLIFAAYLYFCFRIGAADETADEAQRQFRPVRAVVSVIAGLAGLIAGGRMFVDNAVWLAEYFGVSEKFISITILAGGTSLPELVTCLVAVAKGKNQLALGNILGSNIFNILLILGCSSIITPLSFSGMTFLDMGFLLLSGLILLLWTKTGRKSHIDRWEGALMIALYIGYLAFLAIGG